MTARWLSSRTATALRGTPGLWWSGWWGFAEATLFFVVPDVLFTLTMILSPKRGWLQFGGAVAGALAGGAVMYLWAATSPVNARAAVAAVPFVGEDVITPAEQRWDEQGARGLFANPLSGVPYKVYAVLAPPRLSLSEFVALSAPLRIERMALSLIIFAPLARWVRRRDETRRRITAVRVHAIFWALVYAAYWSLNYA